MRKEHICLSVEGLPPKKNEAISLFSPKHGDRLSVLKLLRETKQALDDSAWNPTQRRPVGLEPLVTAEKPDVIPGDATNHLGDVADVLQANRINVDLAHLVDLADESLFQDDRQIRDVPCSIKASEAFGYGVRVWVL